MPGPTKSYAKITISWASNSSVSVTTTLLPGVDGDVGTYTVGAGSSAKVARIRSADALGRADYWVSAERASEKNETLRNTSTGEVLGFAEGWTTGNSYNNPPNAVQNGYWDYTWRNGKAIYSWDTNYRTVSCNLYNEDGSISSTRTFSMEVAQPYALASLSIIKDQFNQTVHYGRIQTGYNDPQNPVFDSAESISDLKGAPLPGHLRAGGPHGGNGVNVSDIVIECT